MSNSLNIKSFIIILLVSFTARAEFTSTYSLNSSTVKNIQDWIDQDTLILIAIDETIVMPKANMFSFDSNPNRQFIETLVSLSNRVPAYKNAVAIWYQQRELKLVEEGWAQFIEAQKKKGAKIFGICSMPLHLINIEEKRLAELKELGINFTDNINGQTQLIIENQELWFSHFYKGIIFIGPYSKSHTIMEFLKVSNLAPKKLLFIDSVKHELKQLDANLEVFYMKYYNIHYLGAKEVRGKPNADIMAIQQQELIRNGRWVEDETAAELLQVGTELKAN